MARDAIEFIGILCLAACTIYFAALWWTAFLTDDVVRVTIAEYGERYPEALLWFLITPVMLFAIYTALARLHHDDT